MHQAEEWHDIPGYEGHYSVSSLGRVKSLRRTIVAKNGIPRTISEKLLLPGLNTNGRLQVRLSSNGIAKDIRIHQAVMLAFVGPYPLNMEICHNDGNPLNNNLNNLRYDTKSANCLDRTLHGNDKDANKTHCIRGHEYNKENTYIDPRGKRQCNVCNRERYQRNKRAQNGASFKI